MVPVTLFCSCPSWDDSGAQRGCDSHMHCWHFHQFAPSLLARVVPAVARTVSQSCASPREDSRQAWRTAVPFLSRLLRRSPWKVSDLLGKLNTATLFRPTGLGFCSEHSCKGQAAVCNVPRTPAEAEVLCPERLST